MDQSLDPFDRELLKQPSTPGERRLEKRLWEEKRERERRKKARRRARARSQSLAPVHRSVTHDLRRFKDDRDIAQKMLEELRKIGAPQNEIDMHEQQLHHAKANIKAYEDLKKGAKRKGFPAPK